MPDAFLLGGGGQVGRSVARRLLEEGWAVRVATRSGRPVEGADGVAVDRAEPGALAVALGGGADLLLACVCYDEEQAGQLLGVGDRVASLVVLSSLSVYADARGHSLDEARTPEEFPTSRCRSPRPSPRSRPARRPTPPARSRWSAGCWGRTGSR